MMYFYFLHINFYAKGDLMKIKKIAIKKFKIFDDICFDFTNKENEINDIIILAGINGTGKTTLLNIIYDLFNNKFENYFKSNQNNKEDYLIDFELFDELNNKNIFVSVSKNKIQWNNAEYFNEIKPEKIINLMHLSNLNTFKNYKDEIIKLVNQPIIKKIMQNKNIPPIDIINGEINNIKNIFSEFEILSELIEFEDDDLIFKSANNTKVSFDNLSEGEKQLYVTGIYLYKLNINNSIILVDEPEKSIHPIWQQNILKLYQKIGTNNQIITATHSPHIINNVNPTNIKLLISENNKIVLKSEDEIENIYGMPVKKILELMGLKSDRNIFITQKIHLLEEKLKNNDIENSEIIIKELKKILSPYDEDILNYEILLNMIKVKKQR